ncbi:hypothetical protein V9R52_000874 [Vibrio mimicus]
MSVEKQQREPTEVELLQQSFSTQANLLNQTQNEVKELKSEYAQLSDKYTDLNISYVELKARTDATVDFSDDLVSASSQLISSTEQRVNVTLEHTENVLQHADALVSFYLVVISIAIAIVGAIGSIYIQYRTTKSREAHLTDAVKKLTSKLKDDEDFRREFIQSLVTHESLRQNINTAIDSVAKEYAGPKEDDPDDFSEFTDSLDTSKG